MIVALWVFIALVFIFGFVVFRGAPYVPSHRSDIKRAFDELYPLSSQDVLVDIGSGDGIVLRAAARHGATAVGYELNPILVALSRLMCKPWQDIISIHLADFWHVHLPKETTVVYGFMVSRDLHKLERKLQEHVNGTERNLQVILYGMSFKNRPSRRTLGAHSLYEFTPLHES